MSKRRLTRQQIKFLKQIFKNNDSLKELSTYERHGTLDGVLKQVEEGCRIVLYMAPTTNESYLKNKITTYKYKTMVVEENVSILEKVKSFFNKFRNPESPKPLEQDELIRNSLDYMKGNLNGLVKKNTKPTDGDNEVSLLNSFAGEIQYLQNKDATYFKGKDDEWIKYPDMETITTEELKNETTNP